MLKSSFHFKNSPIRLHLKSAVFFHQNISSKQTSFLSFNQLASFVSSKCFSSKQMETERINLLELLSVCIQSAEQAQEIIRRVWKSGKLGIKQKGFDDPFTRADVRAQQLIVSTLLNKWENLSIVGEEECEISTSNVEINLNTLQQFNDKIPEELKTASLQDVVVFVDPLDATKEYTKGDLEPVTTLIGIAFKGKPIGGVISRPFVNSSSYREGSIIYGLKGMGVHGVEFKKRNDSKFVLTTTSSHFDQTTQQYIDLLKPDVLLRTGGCGNKVVLVLNGIADVYIYPSSRTKKWDTCAPEALLRICGGILTDLNGKAYEYFKHSEKENKTGLICCMDANQHSHFVEKIKPFVSKF